MDLGIAPHPFLISICKFCFQKRQQRTHLEQPCLCPLLRGIKKPDLKRSLGCDEGSVVLPRGVDSNPFESCSKPPSCCNGNKPALTRRLTRAYARQGLTFTKGMCREVQSLRSVLSTTHLSNATAYAALYATYFNGSAYANTYAALRDAGFGSRKHPLIPAPD